MPHLQIDERLSVHVTENAHHSNQVPMQNRSEMKWNKLKYHKFVLADLSTSKMVHKSTRATLDRSDIVYCTNLCDIFMDQSAIFQFRKCLHILFHCSWLLWRFVSDGLFSIGKQFEIVSNQKYSTTKKKKIFYNFLFQLSWFITFYPCVMNIWVAKEISCRKYVENRSNHHVYMEHVVWLVINTSSIQSIDFSLFYK